MLLNPTKIKRFFEIVQYPHI